MTKLFNNSQTYGLVHIVLHWATAMIIIGILALGYYMTNVPFNPTLYFIHKSFGVLVIFLVIFRIMWKLANPHVKEDSKISLPLKVMASLGHYTLYLFMLLMPISGMFYSLYRGKAISFFNIFVIPPFEAYKPMGDFFKSSHEILSILFIALILVHSLMAIFHHYVLKDNVLIKMLPLFAKK